jgi:hypothetical protein
MCRSSMEGLHCGATENQPCHSAVALILRFTGLTQNGSNVVEIGQSYLGTVAADTPSVATHLDLRFATTLVETIFRKS